MYDYFISHTDFNMKLCPLKICNRPPILSVLRLYMRVILKFHHMMNYYHTQTSSMVASILNLVIRYSLSDNTTINN